MKRKTTDSENSARKDRIYEKPVIRLEAITSEGMLCFSAESTINSYEIEDFEW